MALDNLVIENHIKLFVFAKTGDDVFLDLKRGCISVQPMSKRGSVTLATFWANVLQHEDIFPKCDYEYFEDFDGPEQQNSLVVGVEEVTITVYMKSGVIKFVGEFVYEWFKRKIPWILTTYDEALGVQPEDYGMVETSRGMYEGENNDLRSPDQSLTKTNEKGLDGELCVKYPVVSCGVTIPSVMKDTMDGLMDSVEKLDLEQLSEDEMSASLKDASKGCVRDGATFIYELWKGLLHRWFSEGHSVTIATPMIDIQRFTDIIDMMFKNNSAKIDSLFLQYQSDDNKKVSEIKNEILDMDTYTPAQKLHIEYKLFSKCNYPVKRFNCNFLACVKQGMAEVLVTSAGFHGKFFEQECLESVIFLKMKEEEFYSQYIEPLISSVGPED